VTTVYRHQRIVEVVLDRAICRFHTGAATIKDKSIVKPKVKVHILARGISMENQPIRIIAKYIFAEILFCEIFYFFYFL